MLIGSVNIKGNVYRLVMVKRKVKTVYYVNHFNTVGFAGSVSFNTLCSAYKYLSQFKSNQKTKSNNNSNQVSLW